MQIDAKEAKYDMEWKKLDFETRDVRHEGNNKLVPQIRNSHTRARELVKKFIANSYDIGFLRSNMRIKGNEPIYDMELKKLDFESRGVRHEGKRKLVPQIRNTHIRAPE